MSAPARVASTTPPSAENHIEVGHVAREVAVEIVNAGNAKPNIDQPAKKEEIRAKCVLGLRKPGRLRPPPGVRRQFVDQRARPREGPSSARRVALESDD